MRRVSGPIRSVAIRLLRAYLARFPFPRGKGLITRRLFWPLLPPPPGSFVATIPTGGRVILRYREAIGLAQYVNGSFEEVELRALRARLSSGNVVFDVGANVGYFTIPFALAVGDSGRVIACEPEAENVQRLADNVALNSLVNVEIKPIAIGTYDGEAELFLGDDSVYHTTAVGRDRLPITGAHETGRSVRVDIARLDTLWRESGAPAVALIKIDVEGTELSVLEGGKDMIESCRPDLLIETESPQFDDVKQMLSAFGYTHSHPEGFTVSNHLFTAG